MAKNVSIFAQILPVFYLGDSKGTCPAAPSVTARPLSNSFAPDSEFALPGFGKALKALTSPGLTLAAF
jgi:hypothetical protein